MGDKTHAKWGVLSKTRSLTHQKTAKGHGIIRSHVKN